LKKSGRHPVIGDQQKTSWLEEAIFPLLDSLDFDLEPMVPGAGQSEKRRQPFSDIKTEGL
jgi:hypothetical protein